MKNNVKTKIKPLFNKIDGYTPALIKEAHTHTGISIRMLQHYYRNENIVPGGDKVAKLLAFFEFKLGKELKITDILNERNIEHEIKEKAKAIFRSTKKIKG